MSGWLIILTGIIYAYVAFDQAIQGSSQGSSLEINYG
jgi:hypothetical protein